jgi:hypothetical protein
MSKLSAIATAATSDTDTKTKTFLFRVVPFLFYNVRDFVYISHHLALLPLTVVKVK